MLSASKRAFPVNNSKSTTPNEKHIGTGRRHLFPVACSATCWRRADDQAGLGFHVVAILAMPKSITFTTRCFRVRCWGFTSRWMTPPCA